jgi:hypothetical protein
MYLFPAGGQRGTDVQLRVGGLYFHDACGFAMEGQGIDATTRIERTQTRWFEGPLIPIPDSQQAEDYPQDHLGRVAISPDAWPGQRPWRVWTSQGVTAARPFVVGDLPEIVEEETDGAPLPVHVALPVTINGRIFPREDVDVYTFDCQTGQIVTCAVLAGRLGSPLDARIEIRDPTGRRIAESAEAGTAAADALVRFSVPADGRYQALIHDVRFGGLQHYVYRLTITAGPFADALFPLGARLGTTSRFEVLGPNLEAPFASVTLPAGGSPLQQLRLEGTGAANSLPVETGDLPELLEQEPNDDLARVEPVALPAVCNGRIERPGDVDLWAFRADKGMRLEFDLRAARLGSPLDATLAISNARGKVLLQVEDLGASADPRLTFTAPEDGLFVARVAEQLPGRGGPAFAYRLQARVPEPGFTLHCTDALTVTRGAEASLNIKVERTGGFAGEIALEVSGLPAGLTVRNDTVPGNASELGLVFKAGAGARPGVSRVGIRGSAIVDGRQVVRQADVKTGFGDLLAVDQLMVAVALPTPFKIKGVYEVKYAARGTQFTRRFTIDRGGYQGPLEVRLADRQTRHLQGVTGPSITVPPEATQFNYTVNLPPWMEIGRTSRSVVMATGTLVEPDGSTHKVSFASAAQNEQIVALIDPGPLSLDLDRNSATLAAGESIRLRARIGRGPGQEGPVQLGLVLPGHLRGVSAEPVTVPANQDSAELVVRLDANEPGPFNMPLTVRARLVKDDGSEVVAEAKLAVLVNTGP